MIGQRRKGHLEVIVADTVIAEAALKRVVPRHGGQ